MPTRPDDLQVWIETAKTKSFHPVKAHTCSEINHNGFLSLMCSSLLNKHHMLATWPDYGT